MIILNNMDYKDKIYVAGHRGMVGSAILRALHKEGFENLIYRTSTELDLRNQSSVSKFFQEERPKYVFLAAAKVGGIQANNTMRAQFLYENLMIEANIIHSAYEFGVEKLLFLGSSCIYPKFASQPITEDQLLAGYLEPTNEPYAIAKIVGIKLCDAYRAQYGCNFISAMPTNLYGPNDNYDLSTSHVLPALIRKIHEAKLMNTENVEIWGTGTPMREFLYVDDLAEACLFLMRSFDESGHINVGSGEEISIKNLAILIREIVGWNGSFVFNESKPDGTPRKLMSSARIFNLGWQPKYTLKEGIKRTYNQYKINTN